MSRKYLYAAILFLIHFQIFGQSFGDNNSLWVYDVITGGLGSEILHGIIKVEPGKDTVVANIPSRNCGVRIGWVREWI